MCDAASPGPCGTASATAGSSSLGRYRAQVPSIDVVMPVYRGRRFLAEAIESLNAQIVDDWALTVVDDACPDATGGAGVGPGPGRERDPPGLPGGRGRRPRGWHRDGEPPRWWRSSTRTTSGHSEKLALQIEALRTRPTAGACHTDGLVVDEVGGARGPPTPTSVESATGTTSRFETRCGPSSRGTGAPRVPRPDPPGGVDEVEDNPTRTGEDWGFWIRVLGGGHRLAHLAEPLYLWRSIHGQHLQRRATRCRPTSRPSTPRDPLRPPTLAAARWPGTWCAADGRGGCPPDGRVRPSTP